jgi:hypothetical protein
VLNVIHDSPGRLRVAIPAMAGSAPRARACEDALRQIPGVRHVSGSNVTGNLLVVYTPSAPTRSKIEEQCAAWTEAASARVGGRQSPHGHAAGAAGLTVAAELARHLLPLVFGACPICRGR